MQAKNIKEDGFEITFLKRVLGNAFIFPDKNVDRDTYFLTEIYGKLQPPNILRRGKYVFAETIDFM